MYMNLGITKKIQRSGVVMNPTIHPARKRNVAFNIPNSHYQHNDITIMQMSQNRELGINKIILQF